MWWYRSEIEINSPIFFSLYEQCFVRVPCLFIVTHDKRDLFAMNSQIIKMANGANGIGSFDVSEWVCVLCSVHRIKLYFQFRDQDGISRHKSSIFVFLFGHTEQISTIWMAVVYCNCLVSNTRASKVYAKKCHEVFGREFFFENETNTNDETIGRTSPTTNRIELLGSKTFN